MLDSETINSNDDNASGGSQTDMEQMLKFMEMFKMVQNLGFNQPKNSSQNQNQGDDTQNLPITLPTEVLNYDEKIQTPALKAIKAAIPYLENKHRKNMSIMVKLIEIQKLLSFYGESTRIMQAEYEGDWRKNMLMSIRPYMTAQKQYTLDMLVKCIDISELLAKMRSVSELAKQEGTEKVTE